MIPKTNHVYNHQNHEKLEEVSNFSVVEIIADPGSAHSAMFASMLGNELDYQNQQNLKCHKDKTVLVAWLNVYCCRQLFELQPDGAEDSFLNGILFAFADEDIRHCPNIFLLKKVSFEIGIN